MRSLLADLGGGTSPCAPVDPDAVGELLVWFRAECEALVSGCDPAVLPLRLPKGRISDLLACERGTVAALGEAGLTEPLVRGRLTDVLVAQHVTFGIGTDVELEVHDALAAAASDVIDWLEQVSEPVRAGVWAHARATAAGLVRDWGPIERSWWPRLQERLTVPVADGALVLSAQFDLVLGGAPTDRPWVVLEAKSGSVADRHRTDLYWYALVATLRHGHPPSLCATWFAGDGGLVPVPVSLGALEAAGQRGLAALARLVELVEDRPPDARPHAGCAWCPALDRCEPGLARTGADQGVTELIDAGTRW